MEQAPKIKMVGMVAFTLGWRWRTLGKVIKLGHFSKQFLKCSIILVGYMMIEVQQLVVSTVETRGQKSKPSSDYCKYGCFISLSLFLKHDVFVIFAVVVLTTIQQ